jgi:UDP-3-O-acyl-N-acetylglucosamine deacetylase
MFLKDLNKDFCFDYGMEVLQKKGLVLVGSADNAIIIALDTYKELLRYK